VELIVVMVEHKLGLVVGILVVGILVLVMELVNKLELVHILVLVRRMLVLVQRMLVLQLPMQVGFHFHHK
jgi:hypothetical protein